MTAVPDVAVKAVRTALLLLPQPMTSPEAAVMLYATGLQESGFRLRRQMGGGPARGLWQFERGGGVKGVCEHAASRYWMSHLCDLRGIPFNTDAVYSTLEVDDVLAAGAARLLYFTDPRRLPDIDDAESAWNLYIRTWRPGKPKRASWAAAHAAGVLAIQGDLL